MAKNHCPFVTAIFYFGTNCGSRFGKFFLDHLRWKLFFYMQLVVYPNGRKSGFGERQTGNIKPEYKN